MENYKMNMTCNNCGHQFVESFTKGTGCGGKNTCPNCGCQEAISTTPFVTDNIYGKPIGEDNKYLCK